MWKTKLTPKDNGVPIEIQVGDNTNIRLVRSGLGVISVVVDAPRDTLIRKNEVSSPHPSRSIET